MDQALCRGDPGRRIGRIYSQGFEGILSTQRLVVGKLDALCIEAEDFFLAQQPNAAGAIGTHAEPTAAFCGQRTLQGAPTLGIDGSDGGRQQQPQ
ncbi:MAG: hypothetical protein H7833_16135, partial [Magnetococcus sp. DMHC-1]